MNSSTKLALAAFTGLFAAGVAAPAFAGSADQGTQASSVKVAQAKEKHACKGLNSCKGQGADGKNSCKGKGSCRTDGGTPPSV